MRVQIKKIIYYLANINELVSVPLYELFIKEKWIYFKWIFFYFSVKNILKKKTIYILLSFFIFKKKTKPQIW